MFVRENRRSSYTYLIVHQSRANGGCHSFLSPPHAAKMAASVMLCFTDYKVGCCQYNNMTSRPVLD